jgi:Ca2+/Na+ antiporter
MDGFLDSVTDTFASKVAAVQDEYADASVGNVTGSNAVNVFLGIGIAWTMAAFYHGFMKDTTGCMTPVACSRQFHVDPGRYAKALNYLI